MPKKYIAVTFANGTILYYPLTLKGEGDKEMHEARTAAFHAIQNLIEHGETELHLVAA